jgi:hypothetical protein
MALKLRAGAATDKRDSLLQEWPPRPDSFKRGLGAGQERDPSEHICIIHREFGFKIV